MLQGVAEFCHFYPPQKTTLPAKYGRILPHRIFNIEKTSQEQFRISLWISKNTKEQNATGSGRILSFLHPKNDASCKIWQDFASPYFQYRKDKSGTIPN